jgi:hypothetical protein
MSNLFSGPLADQQHQLILDGPRHGIPTAVMQQVVDLLSQVAQDLDHLTYYLLRYPHGAWLVLETPPSGSWIPVFGHEADAEDTRHRLGSQAQFGEDDADLLVESMGVLDLLFLILGLQQSTGILVYDTLGDRQNAKTIAQAALKQRFQQQLEQAQPRPKGSSHLA